MESLEELGCSWGWPSSSHSLDRLGGRWYWPLHGLENISAWFLVDHGDRVILLLTWFVTTGSLLHVDVLCPCRGHVQQGNSSPDQSSTRPLMCLFLKILGKLLNVFQLQFPHLQYVENVCFREFLWRVNEETHKSLPLIAWQRAGTQHVLVLLFTWGVCCLVGSPLESRASCGKTSALKESIPPLGSRDRKLWSSGLASDCQ